MIAQHPKNISACVFFARCETPQLFGTMGKVTAARLRDAAHLAANKVVSEMAARLDAPLPADALQCAYVGTQEEDAPLTSRTPIVFEWRLRGGGVAKTNTTAMRVLHKGHKNGLALPVSLRKAFLLLCLPAYLEKKKNLAFLSKVTAVRCHRLVAARPVLKYNMVTTCVHGSTADLILCAHIEEDTYLCAPVPPARKEKFTAVTVTGTHEEVLLKRPNSGVDLLCAKAQLEVEKHRAKLEQREVDMQAATRGFVTDVCAFPRAKEVTLLWSARTREGWELRANEICVSRFRNL